MKEFLEEAVRPPSTIDLLRVFCVTCERRAEILWCQREPSGMLHLVHVRCHGEERLVVLDHFYVRKGEAVGWPHLDVFWGQLKDFGDDDALQRLIEETDVEITKRGEAIRAIESVLKSRSEGRKR